LKKDLKNLANIFETKCAIDKQEKIYQLRKIPNILPKFGELWLTNGYGTTCIHGAWLEGRPSDCNSPALL